VSRRRSAGFLRGLSGLLAGGFATLTVGLVVVWFVATRYGTAGPGPSTLIWHAVGAVAAVAGQVYADRHDDARGTVAALGVIAVTAGVLAAQWLF
jgi:hypothetical protein